jgi:hypothetical protein
VLTVSEVEQYLSFGYERREFEVKGPGLRTDVPLSLKVARAALSMGNLQDGGFIAVGIDDGSMQAMTPGLTEEQLKSWLKYDDLADLVNKYSDPPLRFDVASLELTNGKNIALIQVYEFADLPHICARSYDLAGKTELKKGALYVRSRGKPATVEVSSSVEMREVLDLASAKRLRDFMRTAERAGVSLEGGPTDDDQYATDIAEAWKS